MGFIKALKMVIRKNSTGSDFIRRRLNLIEGTNITLTVTDDSTDNEVDVTIAASGGGGLTWNEVTGTSQAMAVDNGYIANNASLVTLTLPTTAALGKTMEVSGKGAGGWKLAQNASQLIHFGSVDTTTGTGGYLQSNHRYDALRILCITANTDFIVLSSQGNITYN